MSGFGGDWAASREEAVPSHPMRSPTGTYGGVWAAPMGGMGGSGDHTIVAPILDLPLSPPRKLAMIPPLSLLHPV
jgi:hypothetical protein